MLYKQIWVTKATRKNDDLDEATIHSNAKDDPVIGMLIENYAINFGKNKIIIPSTHHSPAHPKISYLFDYKELE